MFLSRTHRYIKNATSTHVHSCHGHFSTKHSLHGNIFHGHIFHGHSIHGHPPQDHFLQGNGHSVTHGYSATDTSQIDSLHGHFFHGQTFMGIFTDTPSWTPFLRGAGQVGGSTRHLKDRQDRSTRQTGQVQDRMYTVWPGQCFWVSLVHGLGAIHMAPPDWLCFSGPPQIGNGRG